MQAINALPPQTSTQAPMQTNTLDLNDIHVPEQISNYPIAYGWWLLAALLITLAIIAIIKFRKNNQRNKIKKQALIQLKNTPNMSINEITALLKWAAMHYFSRAELANLFGNSLQSFFTNQLPIKYQERFTSLSEQTFIKQYQANNENHSDEDFYQAATLWLTYALPPKKPNPMKSKENTLNKQQGVNV